jgi:hypothetical protein
MTLEQIIYIGGILGLAALLICVFLLHQHNIMLSNEIQDYQEQIDQLHANAVRANQEAAEARKVADNAVAAGNAKAAQIMRERVPRGCQNAISWLVEQAPSI